MSTQAMVLVTPAELEQLVRKCVREELGARPETVYYTLAEAAKLLKLSTKTVLKRVKEDGLPGERLGHEWRFEKTRLMSWMRERGG
jgi:excisionase family DNA binding protein